MPWFYLKSFLSNLSCVVEWYKRPRMGDLSAQILYEKYCTFMYDTWDFSCESALRKFPWLVITIAFLSYFHQHVQFHIGINIEKLWRFPGIFQSLIKDNIDYQRGIMFLVIGYYWHSIICARTKSLWLFYSVWVLHPDLRNKIFSYNQIRYNEILSKLTYYTIRSLCSWIWYGTINSFAASYVHALRVDPCCCGYDIIITCLVVVYRYNLGLRIVFLTNFGVIKYFFT